MHTQKHVSTRSTTASMHLDSLVRKHVNAQAHEHAGTSSRQARNYLRMPNT